MVLVRAATCLLLIAGMAVAQPDLAAELARAVDLETPKQRRSAALKLAKRGDVTLDQWTAAARAFGSFQPQKIGQLTIL